MHDKCYELPPYPASGIRNYGKGRVFYTSMGYRDDVWTNPNFQSLMTGDIPWATGDDEADTTPNIRNVTSNANLLPPK
jgi:type 1 glutamine amidotransferase